MSQSLEIFCWAAQADRPFLMKLLTQLTPKQQHGIITLWEQSHIMPGANADEEIRQHLASARILLLFIGPDFLADRYCYDTVLKAALERHIRREAITIPVIVRPAYWQDVHVLNGMQVLPRNGQPISMQPDQETALWEVAQEIDAAIKWLGGPLVAPNSNLGYKPYGGERYSPHMGRGSDAGAFPMGQPPLKENRHRTSAMKTSSSSGHKRSKMGVMFVLLAVLILGGGTAFVALNAKGSNNMGNGSTPFVTSTHTSSTNSVTPFAQAQNTPTIGPTSLPTASLSSPRLPLKIPCVNCPYPQLTATLNRIDIDSAAQVTRWVFSLSNGGQYPCSTLHFYPIQLTDSRGTSYEGQGQGARDNQFAIDVGQSIQVNAAFGVIPAPNTEYTMQAIIYLGGCNIPGSIGTPNTYQTENFTFA